MTAARPRAVRALSAPRDGRSARRGRFWSRSAHADRRLPATELTGYALLVNAGHAQPVAADGPAAPQNFGSRGLSAAPPAPLARGTQGRRRRPSPRAPDTSSRVEAQLPRRRRWALQSRIRDSAKRGADARRRAKGGCGRRPTVAVLDPAIRGARFSQSWRTAEVCVLVEAVVMGDQARNATMTFRAETSMTWAAKPPGCPGTVSDDEPTGHGAVATFRAPCCIRDLVDLKLSQSGGGIPLRGHDEALEAPWH